ncbi:nucleotidyltransferase domain-containing protein [Peredibacter sp. HCB2-198]|uniref:nucleotidyltransferase domain-containing protein n=1 Tax=Peredibacter sp. HCB2-198 TaxID=3383025 RepID=UPI0038B693C7
MNQFGLSDKYIKLIKQIIQDVFGSETDAKVYIFGSRATGKHRRNSDIDFAIKSQDLKLDKKITLFRDKIENSALPYKIDIAAWDDLLKEYLPKIEKEKKFFWSKKDAIIFSPWRLCPIGYHWVSEHLKTGNLDSTDPHCRKNPTKKDILKTDEIKKISELDIFKTPAVKATTDNLGYKDGNSFDGLINGWCAYWNDVFKITPPLHPNHVKALIATESGFRINPERNEKHTAIGITQLMPKTINLLSSRSNELRDHFLEISKEDAFDPNVNISASIRWLFRKRELAVRKKKDIDWLDTLEEYKGITLQSSKKPTHIKSKLRKFYETLSSN